MLRTLLAILKPATAHQYSLLAVIVSCRISLTNMPIHDFEVVLCSFCSTKQPGPKGTKSESQNQKESHGSLGPITHPSRKPLYGISDWGFSHTSRYWQLTTSKHCHVRSLIDRKLSHLNKPKSGSLLVLLQAYGAPLCSLPNIPITLEIASCPPLPPFSSEQTC